MESPSIQRGLLYVNKQMYHIDLIIKLNVVATIGHLCKMTVATSQGWPPVEGGIYCNVSMIVATATFQKPDNFMIQIILIILF